MKKSVFFILLFSVGVSKAQFNTCPFTASIQHTTVTYSYIWPIIGTQSVDSIRFDYGDNSPSVVIAPVTASSYQYTFPSPGSYYTCITRYISDLVYPDSLIICTYCDSVFTYPFPTGLSSSKSDNLTFFPNPARDYFTITDINDDEKILSIFNISGKLLFRKKYKDSYIKVLTTEYTAGLYFIELRKGDYRLVERLILE